MTIDLTNNDCLKHRRSDSKVCNKISYAKTSLFFLYRFFNGYIGIDALTDGLARSWNAAFRAAMMSAANSREFLGDYKSTQVPSQCEASVNGDH